MKKLFIVAIAALSLMAMTSPVAAQDAHIGTIQADPPFVPEAGEYDLVAAGTGWLPDTEILLVKCISPADTLVPGESSTDDIVAAGGAIAPLADCDLGSAVPVTVDGDGNFTEQLTAEVGDNFFFSAGALDGSQAGAAWIPVTADPSILGGGGEEAAAEEVVEEEVVEEEAPAEEEAVEEAAPAAELPETGAESWFIALGGLTLLLAGALVMNQRRQLS